MTCKCGCFDFLVSFALVKGEVGRAGPGIYLYNNGLNLEKIFIIIITYHSPTECCTKSTEKKKKKHKENQTQTIFLSMP